MIIVSQEKTRIINFSNILQLYITKEEDAENYYIRYEDVNNSYEDLGKYKSLERAKEVLELIKFRYLQYGSIQNHYGNVANAMTLPRAFEMPEE